MDTLTGMVTKLATTVDSQIARQGTPNPGAQRQSPYSRALTQGSPAPTAPGSTRTPASGPTPPQRGRPIRVVLRTSKLRRDHPLQTLSEPGILKLIDKPFHESTSARVQTVRRMESGDTAINLASEDDVQRAFKADKDWITKALGHLGDVPALSQPGFTASRSIVLHGVSCSRTEQEIKEELEDRTGMKVEKCNWLVGTARRGQRASSSMVITLDSPRDRDDLLRRRAIGIANSIVYADEFRPRPRLEQCDRCQSLDHKTVNCKAPLPRCRVCAEQHPTKEHPACRTCAEVTHDDDADGGQQTRPRCTHQQHRCANCGGPHAASNRDCQVRRNLLSALW